MQLTSPVDFEVARPYLELAGTCTDDQQGGCQQLDVKRYTSLHSDYALVTTVPLDGSGPFRTILWLRDLDGFHSLFRFIATGASGDGNPVVRSIAVDTNPRLEPELRTPGDIAAADAEHALVYETGAGWKILWRDGGSDAVPFPFDDMPWVDPYALSYVWAAMTPRGAIAFTAGLAGGYFEWTGSTVIDLQTRVRPAFAGDWIATFEVDGGAMLVRNEATGEQWSDPGPGQVPFAVTADGTLFVTRPCLTDAGCLDRVTADGGHTLLPLDRPRHLYISEDRVVFATDSAVGRIHPSGSIEICDRGKFTQQVSGPWYWVAYAGLTDPIGRICDEDGGVRPLHPYGAPYPFIVGADRTVILRGNGHRYLADPVAPPLDLGLETGRLDYFGGGRRVSLGNTLFRLSLVPDAGPPLGSEDAGSTPPGAEPDGCSCGAGGVTAVALLLLLGLRRRLT